MDYTSATLYGVVQGLTEFLPVSSSAHLALIPHVLKIKDPGVSFDLAMHLGTSLAVIGYFFKQFKAMALGVVSADKTQRNIALNLFVAMLGTFVMALLFRSLAQSFGRSTFSMGMNLILFGLLMWLADRFLPGLDEGQWERPQYFKAVMVGLAQGLAIFPGVSRSGATIGAQRFLKIGLKESTYFSFLLSAPIIIAGFILNLPHFVKEVSAADWPFVFYGAFVSGLVGIVTIHYFLKFVSRIGLGAFTFYRVALGLVLISHFLGWWS